MKVTHYFKKGEIEYKEVLDFVVFVERPELVPAI